MIITKDRRIVRRVSSKLLLGSALAVAVLAAYVIRTCARTASRRALGRHVGNCSEGTRPTGPKRYPGRRRRRKRLRLKRRPHHRDSHRRRADLADRPQEAGDCTPRP